jgi:tetratricopeptide (TPR) repeat protein
LAAIKLDAKAVADYPKLTQFRASLSQSQYELGRLFRTTGRIQEAEPVYRQAVENQKILVAEAPGQAPGRPYYQSQFVGILCDLALVLSQSGQAQQAAEVVNQLLEIQPISAAEGNGLAWFLATCPDEKLRHPRRAVELARKAVELEPKSRSFWNTLGAALYRAGDWRAAIQVLEKSMELSKGGDSIDWFFLAMAHKQLGETDKARAWYDKAVEWMDKNRPTNEELLRFRADAEELMKKE